MHLSRLRFAALLAITPLFTGCKWISLAANALTYHTMQPGEVGNLVARDSIVYATRGTGGLAILDGRSGTELGTVPTPSASESIDDIAIDGELLFALDAQPPGHVAIFSLADPLHPQLVSAPQSAPVGPFSGISARDGIAMVSGGTSELTVWEYDVAGRLYGPVATSDLGRGQPDILVSRGGLALVSTHYWGPYFGLELIRYDSTSRSIVRLGSLKLDGAGFTAGGVKPANFPIDAAMIGSDTVLVAFARGVAVIDVSSPSAPRLHGALAAVVTSLAVDFRIARRLVVGAFAAVSVGAIAATFKYDVVARYRIPVLLIALTGVAGLVHARFVERSSSSSAPPAS